jgi:pSer/pThr/pTyr-binding forkhead associated (FHA) protein/tetratricopeptide (TPR) repeat protein
MFKIKVRYHGAEYKQLTLDPSREYIIGRGQQCDLVLEDASGVSRQHARVYYQNESWRLQVLSKFGTLNYNGESISDTELEIDSIFKIPPYDFFYISEQESAPQNSDIKAEEPSVENFSTAQEVKPDEFSEHTMVGQVELIPYIRVSKDGQTDDELFRLEGQSWLAGRDESCAIFLNHSAASRRQFRLESKPQGYFITDLGSSNGTSLNGQVLPKNETVPLRSGDVITLRGMTLQFEVRDPNFKNKLTQIPQDLLAPPQLPAIATSPAWGVTAAGERGGVIHLNAHNLPEIGRIDSTKNKQKKLILAAIGAAALILAFIFGSTDSKPKPKNIAQQNQAFEKLTPSQRQLVKDSYNLAKNLHLAGKYELAADQLKKLHELMPEGYLDSRKLAEDCDEAFSYQKRVEELRQEKDRIEGTRKKVSALLLKCDEVSRRATSVEEIRSCLAEAVELDPENAEINTLIDRVAKRVEETKVKNMERADYSDKLQRAHGLFFRAQRLEHSGDLLGAITAYQVVIKSSLPDPGNLKSQSAQRIEALQATISSEVQKHLQAAEGLHKSGALKDALNELDKAQKIDPHSQPVADLNHSVQRELNGQLQEIYSNSVLDEGLGNIEAAKEKWRKIIELDRPQDAYYKRAKDKLKTYGAM